MGIQTKLEFLIGLNNVVWLIWLGSGSNCDMRIAIFQFQQGRARDEPDHGAFVFILKPLKRRKQKWGGTFVGRHDEITGNFCGPAARSSGQLVKLLLCCMRHAQQVSDTILGILVPVMIYLLWRKTGAKVWAGLIVYNALGAFDYSHGLATQMHYPQMIKGSVSAVIYTAIGLGMIFNLIVTLMMFRGDVMRHFLKQPA
jgi:hypothetical protein